MTTTKIAEITRVHVTDLAVGDIVIIDSTMYTVNKGDLSSDSLFGAQYRGHNHHDTGGYVDVVLFPKWSKGKIVAYVRGPQL